MVSKATLHYDDLIAKRLEETQNAVAAIEKQIRSLMSDIIELREEAELMVSEKEDFDRRIAGVETEIEGLRGQKMELVRIGKKYKRHLALAATGGAAPLRRDSDDEDSDEDGVTGAGSSKKGRGLGLVGDESDGGDDDSTGLDELLTLDSKRTGDMDPFEKAMLEMEIADTKEEAYQTKLRTAVEDGKGISALRSSAASMSGHAHEGGGLSSASSSFGRK